MAKPAFNPNAPHTIVQEKPRFNPNAPYTVISNEIYGPPEPPPEEPGLLRQAGEMGLKGLISAGEKIERYAGAPLRAGVATLQEDFTNVPGAVKAVGAQFGEDPSLQPSMKQIWEKAGVRPTPLSEVVPSIYSETGKGLALQRGGILDPTASGVLGAATDPAGILPYGKMAGLIAAKPTAKMAAAVSGSVAPVMQKGLVAAGGLGTKAIAKAGSAATGIPAKAFETYIKRHKQVEATIAKYGNDSQEAVDAFRQLAGSEVQGARRGLNKSITDTLAKSSPEANISLKTVFDKLDKFESRLDPTLDASDIAAIQEIKDLLFKKSPSGHVNVQDLYKVQRYLQGQAKPAYMRGGQIFTKGDDAQRAAKEAAAEARVLLGQSAPEIKQANNQLAALHRVEQDTNRSMLKVGAAPASVIEAGSGIGSRSRKQLERIQNITGTPLVERAEELAAAKHFASPGLTSIDVTGKGAERLLRAGFGAGAAGVAGGIPAMAVGAFLTTPVAWKKAIQAGQISKDVVKSLAGMAGKINDASIKKAFEAAQTPRGQRLIDRFMKASRLAASYDQSEHPGTLAQQLFE